MAQARVALRRFLSRPGLSITAILVVALGVGASTVTYSVVDAVLFRPPPYDDPDGLLSVWSGDNNRSVNNGMPPGETLSLWRGHREIFRGVEGFRIRSMTLSGAGAATDVAGNEVSGGLMSLLGVRPLLGRTVQPTDELPGSARVAVLSEALWREHFGADPRAIGQTVRLDGEPHEVIGVMPRGFEFPYRGQAWVALASTAAPLHLLVRLQDGVSDKAAGRRAATIGWAPASDTPLRLRIELRPFGVTRRGDDARPLYVLLGVVAVMMLIVCANVATLLLADARDRQAEFALRAALGASRVRLIRERLFETALLAGAGGLGGVICAATGVRFLPPLLPDGLLFGVWGGVVLDHRVLAFSLASTVATVFCAGLLPGWRSATAEHAVLKPGSYSVTTDRRHRAVHGGFVVAQLALSLVLVVSGVLLGQTLERLVRVDRGFNGGNLASVVLTVPRWKYSSSPARWDHLERVASRLRMLPGVIDVTASGGAPPTLGSLGMDAILESADGGIVPNGLLPALPFTEIEPNYFDVLRIPIVAGRRFDHSEMDRPSDAVIISASLARRIWPDGRAVAKRWRTDSGEPWMTVVGVAGDVYWFDYAAPRERYAYYVPRTRAGGVGPVQSLVVRVGGDPREALGAIRRQVAGVDPDQPVSKMGTMDDEYAEFFKAPRFAALIVSAFAGMSLVIASIGLYGVLAHAVARRRREFGIRLAIGATPADVARLVVGQGAFVVACGIVAGGTLAAATTRLLGSMLVDLSPLDPLSFGLAAAVLASVALVACSVPAARARRIEPSTLLRAE